MSGERAGLYLHVPFCARICPYCDFAVRTGDGPRRRRYVDHLITEIHRHAGEGWQLDTIYLGGGTPSCLEPADLERILEAVAASLALDPDTRVFLEVNPEDVTPDMLRAWRRLGVHTLSLGIQALNPEGLAFLERLHSAEDGCRAVRLAREAEFPTVSIDLIYGLPGQTPDAWQAEMDRALELAPDHVSCYQLTIHAGTRFGAAARRGTLLELPEDAQADMFRITHRHMSARGMPAYEVSQFATSPAHHSRHNRKYWDHTPYLGLGPAAHSYRDRRRWWNLRKADAWQEALDRGRPPVEAEEILDGPGLALECLMTGLRTCAGVDLETTRTLSGLDLQADNRELIERLCAEGLIEARGDRLIPTLDGLAVADSLAPLFRLEP
ncbi:MAG: radical SAM family heme chaperone HemW [Acidobacteriota bacterium]